MSVCKACGSTKLTEHPCPECGWPILPPAETPPAPVDVPARLRHRASVYCDMANNTDDEQFAEMWGQLSRQAYLLADSYEALTDKEPFWNPTCTLDPCEDCAEYRSLIQRIDSYAEGRKT